MATTKKLTAMEKLAQSKVKQDIPVETQVVIQGLAKAHVRDVYYFDMDTAEEISAALKEDGLVGPDAELFEETIKGDAKAIGGWLEVEEEKVEKRRF